MGDLIVFVIVALICVVGFKSIVKHTKGEAGGCCNTSSKPLELKKKHKGAVVEKIELNIEGMSCDNCRIRVQNALNEQEGAVAHVNLKKKTAVVECEKKTDAAELIRRVKEAGYEASLAK